MRPFTCYSLHENDVYCPIFSTGLEVLARNGAAFGRVTAYLYLAHLASAKVFFVIQEMGHASKF